MFGNDDGANNRDNVDESTDSVALAMCDNYGGGEDNRMLIMLMIRVVMLMVVIVIY